MLGHGAGGGIEARDLAALARELPASGIAVVRVEQPWRVAGKRVAGPPAQLDKAWLVAVPEAVRRTGASGPLFVGGRSAGARVACRTASDVGAAGVVALAFPLHPPGRPDRSRVAELLGVDVPVLVVQGERDSFGGPPELPDGPQVVPVPGADHGLKVPSSGPLSQARGARADRHRGQELRACRLTPPGNALTSGSRCRQHARCSQRTTVVPRVARVADTLIGCGRGD